MAASVRGKTALVTGAGSGINLAFTRLLLAAGCNVVLADLALRPEATKLIQTQFSENSANRQAPRAIFHKTDVSSWKDLSDVYEATKSTFGSVDIVCPGAGVFEPSWSSFWRWPGMKSTAVDTVDGNGYKSLDINLVHPIRLTQLAIIDQIRSRATCQNPSPKTVIHVSSVNGQYTPLWTPLYNASKHALNGFVRSMGPLEKRWQIRVAAVAPGLVKTPLWTDNPKNSAPVSAKTSWVTAEEVAQVMLNIVEKDVISSHARDAGEDDGGNGVQVHGGSIIEVSGTQVRAVEAFNDPGPQGISSEDFDVEQMEEAVFGSVEGQPSQGKTS